MELKDYIRNELQSRIRSSEEHARKLSGGKHPRKILPSQKTSIDKLIANNRAALKTLDSINFDNATYYVEVQKPSDGLSSGLIGADYMGSLEGAAKKARFFAGMTTRRIDYRIVIKVGNEYVRIPEEYWKRFLTVKTR